MSQKTLILEPLNQGAVPGGESINLSMHVDELHGVKFIFTSPKTGYGTILYVADIIKAIKDIPLHSSAEVIYNWEQELLQRLVNKLDAS